MALVPIELAFSGVKSILAVDACVSPEDAACIGVDILGETAR